MMGDLNKVAGVKSEQATQPEDIHEEDPKAEETAEVLDDVAEQEQELGAGSLEALDNMPEGFADLKTPEGRAAVLFAGEDNTMKSVYDKESYQREPDTFVDSSAYQNLATLQETLSGIETDAAAGESIEAADISKVEIAYKATKQHVPEPSVETPEITTKETHRKLDEVYSKTELTEVMGELEALDTRVVEMLGTFFTLYPEDDNRPFEVTSYINQLQDLQASIRQQESTINGRESDTIATDRLLGVTYAELQTFVKTTDRTISNLSNVPALVVFEQLRVDQTRLATEIEGFKEPKEIKSEAEFEVLTDDDLVQAESVPDTTNQAEPVVEDLASEKLAPLVLSKEQLVAPTDPSPAKSKFTPAMAEAAEQPKTSVFGNIFNRVKKALGEGSDTKQARPPRKGPLLTRSEFIARGEKMRAAKSKESESKDNEPVLTGSNSLDWLQRLHGQELGADIYRSKQVLHRLRNQKKPTGDQVQGPNLTTQEQPATATESTDVVIDQNQELRAELARFGQDSLEPDLLPEVDKLDDKVPNETVVTALAPKSVAKTIETKRSPSSETKTEYEAINAAWDDVIAAESVNNSIESNLPETRHTKNEYAAINAAWDDVTETDAQTESPLHMAQSEVLEMDEELIQAKVIEIERAGEGGIDSLFNGYQSPYKVLGEIPFKEIQQWADLDSSELQTILDQYRIKKDTLKQWQKRYPELKKHSQGSENKSFKAVIDEFLLTQKST